MNRSKENTWRVVNGQEPVRSMEDVVANFEQYVSSYNTVLNYEQHTDDTFLNDMLYGLGAALSEENKWGQGYNKFKDQLREFLAQDDRTELYKGRRGQKE